MSDLSRVILDEHAMLEEGIERLYRLNKDLFWLLMQHVSTEELAKQMEEMQSIEKMLNLTD